VGRLPSWRKAGTAGASGAARPRDHP